MSSLAPEEQPHFVSVHMGSGALSPSSDLAFFHLPSLLRAFVQHGNKITIFLNVETHAVCKMKSDHTKV